MPSGSCWCGALKYEYEGEPALKVCIIPPIRSTPLRNPIQLTYPSHQALCHCLTCRKVSGSTNTLNFAVPDAAFHVTAGHPKKFAKEHESGMTLTIYFCDTCGSTIYKEGSADAFKGVKLVQSGTLEDKEEVNKGGFQAELYVSERAGWMGALDGVGQMQHFT
jgi:hypothetical protein